MRKQDFRMEYLRGEKKFPRIAADENDFQMAYLRGEKDFRIEYHRGGEKKFMHGKRGQKFPH